MKDYQIEIFRGSDPLDSQNDNVDVQINFDDGRRYAATFFTVANIQHLMRKWSESGECACGLYFWADYPIIVESLTEDVVTRCVEGLLQEGEFEDAFEKL